MKTLRIVKRFAGTALVLTLAVSLGCKKEKDDYELEYSHYTHVTELEMSCADCHGDINKGSFSMPSHAACIDCHDDVMSMEDVSEETCGVCHKAKNMDDLSKKEVPEAEVPPAGIFVHTDTLSKRCTDCHGDLFDKKVTQVPEMKRSDVVQIREKAHGWEMDCKACHVDMDVQTPPPNHQQNWMRRHGELGEQPDNTCAMCHTEQSCRECHEEMMPASHNNLWRLKTHGISAAWDRERCLVCHEQDSCTACHAEIRPQSHNAAWEKNHCERCHESTETDTGCAFCHEGGLDAHPNPHPANWQNNHCGNCHSGTPESEQCDVCHGGDLLNNHPNPHSAGWRTGHCAQCHEGELNGVSCSACHGGDLLDSHPNPHSANYENTHCNSCHADGEIKGVSCSECHGRDILDDHPNPHSAGFVNSHCTSCHEGSTVNGVECQACHGSDLIDDHPNPHSGNFESSHCNSCHAGSEAEDDCAICHEGGGSVLVHEDFWPEVHDRFGDAANCSDCHQ